MRPDVVVRSACSLALAAVLALLVGSASSAVTTRAYGGFGAVQGGAGAFTSSVQLPGTGYPAARVTTDASSATVPSGASTWFGATTPPGEVFGSSRDRGYLNLAPRANNAGAPSVTTYTFDSPVPVGWGFVLGDIDSDQVQVAATRADGSRASTADLGFRGVFNPCDSTPRPGGCSGPDPQDLPTWEPTTATLTGNPTATNTYGANGWFEPQVPLRTLTLTFAWRSGFPIYQTWLGAVARDVTGTVDVTRDCVASTALVRLLGADGEVLATTRPADDGSYRFDRVAATDQFRVELAEAPVGCEVVGAPAAGVDLRTEDAVADFAVRAVPTGVVGGEVRERGSGDPVAGAELTIAGPGGVDETVVSGQDGGYAFAPLAPGAYEVTLDPPAGFAPVGEAVRDVVVPAGGGPVSLDLEVRAVPASTPAPSPVPSAPAHAGTTPPTGSVATSAAPLPDTGGPQRVLVLGGAALVLAGGAVLRVGRRPTR